jgi:hypothetical protein
VWVPMFELILSFENCSTKDLNQGLCIIYRLGAQ